LINDRMILRKSFTRGMKVLLHDSRLQLWQGKLRSCYIGFFIITHVFSCGAIEIHELAIGAK